MHPQHTTDTIVAISTPPGRGGIGIVRLSGPQAVEIATPLLALRHPLSAGRARHGHLLDEAGQPLDECVVTFFAAPHSYTTEDTVEIATHGAPVLLDYVVRTAIARGARLAEPGEFTRRAFLAGRLDLTQAEAVHDLIESHTLYQAKLAAAQLGGALAHAVQPAKQALIHLIAELEAGVDFVEDDLDLMPDAGIVSALTTIEQSLAALGATYSYGRIVRDGFTLALVGAPNAGKSSLFNALLERDRAIVTAEPGTTRDPIAETLSINGIPVRLVDTAGLRDVPLGAAEAFGIARTHEEIAAADLVLLVSETDVSLVETTRPHLRVRSKADLHPAADSASIRTSARTGEGIPELRTAILQAITQGAPQESALLTNLRQQTAIAQTLAALHAAQAGARSHLPHELLLLDLYTALTALDSLTGATSQDEILAEIFSRFCIGK